MTFAAPVWLLALVPLAAVVIYLLWGRRRQEPVPFLDLWLGPVKGPRPKRRMAAPPLALALAIFAILLAVLGAARPGLRTGGETPVTVIVDHGATMSADQRVATTVAALSTALRNRLDPRSPLDLVVVPGARPDRTDVGGFPSRLTDLAPTAVDTTDILRATVARALSEAGGPVIVLSDRDLSTSDPRFVQVYPESNIENAGIVLFSARESPRAQVMVRVRNDTSSDSATLRVSTGGQEAERAIDLPPRGSTRDCFIDVPSLGAIVRAQLGPVPADAFAGDDAAWLVREGSPPRIEPAGALPAELKRMIDVYASSRVPPADAPRVAVVRDLAALPAASSGVIVAAARETVGSSDVQVRPHPVTRDTRWSFSGAVRVAPMPPAGWDTVVSIGGIPVVAVRESPARQVWVGLEADEWPRTPEYVVFWANVFDWLGAGEVSFRSHPVALLEGRWEAIDLAEGTGGDERAAYHIQPGLWPGLYRRTEDGVSRAVNAGDVRFSRPAGADWRPRLDKALSAHAGAAARPVSGALMLAAAVCVVASAAAWKRSRGLNLPPT